MFFCETDLFLSQKRVNGARNEEIREVNPSGSVTPVSLGRIRGQRISDEKPAPADHLSGARQRSTVPVDLGKAGIADPEETQGPVTCPQTQSSRHRSAVAGTSRSCASDSANCDSISGSGLWSRRLRFTRTSGVWVVPAIAKSHTLPAPGLQRMTMPRACATGRASPIAFLGSGPRVMHHHPRHPVRFLHKKPVAAVRSSGAAAGVAARTGPAPGGYREARSPGPPGIRSVPTGYGASPIPVLRFSLLSGRTGNCCIRAGRSLPVRC